MSYLARIFSGRNAKSVSLCRRSFPTKSSNTYFNFKAKCDVRHTFARKLYTLPDSRSKLIGKWLIGVSGMVSGAVVLGGVTRLTESGLSMVSWKLLGEKLPRTQKDWEIEFEKYKQFPEFQLKNQNLTLNEFKFIFLMEYIHRMWGRAIGFAFLFPAALFWVRGHFSKSMKIKVSIMGSLLAAQGIMGWYMVKSGLENRFDNVNDVPRVSQYRLASHLALAFVLYALTLSTALSVLIPAEKLAVVTKSAARFRYLAHGAKGLIFLTAISGAFVAGLDAGLVYNSFPKMADKWIPDDILTLQPVQKNFTENPTTVQFDHRILGITTLTLSSVLWIFSRRLHLPRRAYWAANAVAAMAWIQATLGITTLLSYVPVPLAAAHQSGSLILLSFAMWLTHELRFIKYMPK